MALFSVFVHNLDSKRECALNKPVDDVELGWVVDTPVSPAAIQRGEKGQQEPNEV